MSQNTKIQWCDDTCNPVMGCQGCELWPTRSQIVKAIAATSGEPVKIESIRQRLKGLLPTDAYHCRKQLAIEFSPADALAQRAKIEAAIASNFRCYAGILHLRHGTDDTQPNKRSNSGYAAKFEKTEVFPGRVADAVRRSDLRGQARPDKPWMSGQPRLIFISDMGDALSGGISFEYLKEEVIGIVTSEKGCRHIWLWLTKRPNRMAKFSEWLAGRGVDWPANLVAMTSVTSSDTVFRVGQLQNVRCQLRGLSIEPLRTSISLPLDGINWAIVGGESGPHASPFQLDWARVIIRQCRGTGTLPFVKQLGAVPFDGDRPLNLCDSHGGDWDEWPTDVRVREFPDW